MIKTYISLIVFFSLISNQLLAQSFNGSFDLVVSLEYQNGNKRSDTLSYYFGKEKTALLIHSKRNQPDLRLVFNVKDSTITGLFEQHNKKGGYILPMNLKYWPGMLIALRDYGTGPRTKLKYSGRIKEIQGFTTQEVIAENEEYTANLWVSNTIELTMSSLLAYQSVGSGKDTKELELFDQFGIEGLPLLSHLKSKTDRADVVIRIINISEGDFDEKIFNTDGYSITKIDE